MPFLTDEIARGLPVPSKGNAVTWDADAEDAPGSKVKGFGLVTTRAGAKTWVLNYRNADGVWRRYKIGRWPAVKAEAARAKARTFAEQVAAGDDLQAKRAAKREAPRVKELARRFLDEHVRGKKRRASTTANYEALIKKYILPSIGSKLVPDLRPADMQRMHGAVTEKAGPFQANRVIAVTSSMLAFAIRVEMRPDGVNVAKAVERHTEAPRQRFLDGEELVRLVAALDEYPDRQAADVVRLLLLTGARKSEVMGMRWGEIDLAKKTWSRPGDRNKNGKDIVVPLSEPAMSVIAELRATQLKAARVLPEYVFPSAASKSKHIVEIHRLWRRVRKSADLDGVRLHDLRHSYASILVSGGESLAMIGKVLGHRSHASTARYAHVAVDPLRVMAEKVGAIFTAAGMPTTPPEPPPATGAEVIQLGKRRDRAR
jgi:integrase